jgi:hypothetical protein
MPRQKDLKRHVRARMQKTGESYTTARVHLVRKPKSSASSPVAGPAAPPLPANYLELARMSDDAVQAKTGKTWPQWIAALDGIGAAGMAHRDIATRVYEMGVSGWWAQNVTCAYERIRGLRESGQSRAGVYTAHKSRTFAVDVDRLFDAFSSAPLRARWLAVEGLRITRVTRAKYVRMRGSDGAHIEVVLVPKGESKSQAAIQHGDLRDKVGVQEAKAFWSDRFDALAALLKSDRA